MQLSMEQKTAFQQCVPTVGFSDPVDWLDPEGNMWCLISDPRITESMCAQMALVAEGYGIAVPAEATFFEEPPEDWYPWIPDDVIPPE